VRPIVVPVSYRCSGCATVCATRVGVPAGTDLGAMRADWLQSDGMYCSDDCVLGGQPPRLQRAQRGAA
jgi:hypothetical protein